MTIFNTIPLTKIKHNFNAHHNSIYLIIKGVKFGRNLNIIGHNKMTIGDE